MTFDRAQRAARVAAVAVLGGCACLAGCTERDLEDAQAQQAQRPAAGATTRASAHPAQAADAPLQIQGVPAFDVTDSDGVLHVLFARPLDGDGKAIQLYHARSDDAGATWSQPVAVSVAHAPPARAQRGDDPQIAARGDRLMALWTARGEGPFGSGPVACALSDDGGRTWRAGPVAPEAQPLPPSAIPPTAPAAQPAATKPSAGPAAAPPHPSAAGKSQGHGGMKGAAKGTGPGYRFPAAAAGDEAFHVVWIHAIGEERSLRHSRLPFGSSRWTEPSVVDPEICACCWNELKVAPDGKVITLYRDVKPSDMVLATSGDGGKTWHSAGRAGAFDWQFDGCPHVGGGIALAGNRSGGGDAILASVWTGNSSATGAYCAALVSSGTWSRPAPLTFADGRGRNTDVAALDGARCATVWDQVMPEGGQAVFAAFSADAGRTWSSPRRVSTSGVNAAYPRVVASGDQYLVLWTTYGAEGETALGSTLVKP